MYYGTKEGMYLIGRHIYKVLLVKNTIEIYNVEYLQVVMFLTYLVEKSLRWVRCRVQFHLVAIYADCMATTHGSKESTWLMRFCSCNSFSSNDPCLFFQGKIILMCNAILLKTWLKTIIVTRKGWYLEEGYIFINKIY